MELISLLIFVLPGFMAPVLWLILGIIFAVKGLDVKRALVLMLSSARSCVIIVSFTVWNSLMTSGFGPGTSGFGPGLWLFILAVSNIAFMIGMTVTVLRFKGSLEVRIISVGLFAFAFLCELSLVSALLGFLVTWLYLGIAELLCIAAPLVFIFGAKKEISSTSKIR